MIRTLFLDFGNVIAFFDHRIATRKLAQFASMDSEAIFHEFYDQPLEIDFEAGLTTADEFVTEAMKRIEYTAPREQFIADFQAIFQRNNPVCDLLPALAQKCRLVLASNTNVLHADYFRRHSAKDLKSFSALGMSFEAKARKPDRKFYAHCQKFSEARLTECLFIDDKMENVIGARQFGWLAELYVPGSDPRPLFRRHGIDV